METIYIHGGISLQGQLEIQGSKNAVLPIMAATLLTEETCEIDNCPRLKDVDYMQQLLESLGCIVTRDKRKLKTNAKNVDILHTLNGMPKDAMKGMRSSIILLGALLGRVGEAKMDYPGGCIIGDRPIDIHIEALSNMNVIFEETQDGLYASTTGLIGADITLKIASVGATENIILAAVCAKGTTIIRNAAREPEVCSLCEFLNLCGAAIEGAGSGCIVIHGKDHISGAAYHIPGDRIVAGTYLCACMAAGGEVLLKQAPTEQMKTVIQYSRCMGATCQETKEGLYVEMHCRPVAIDKLITEPYPGFPTDLQSQFVSVLSISEGICRVEEKIFENRFHTVYELMNMGACIEVIDQNLIKICGVEKLHGYTVTARELRGGAALVVAGVACKGETVIDGCGYIERGYENICRDLRELGVRIYGV